MPRSSTESRTPIARSRSSAVIARSGSVIRLVSVISRISDEGGSVTRASSRATSSTKPGSSRLRGEMFTATENFAGGGLPLLGPGERLTQHEDRQRGDQRAVLGQRDELVGVHPAQPRVVPPGQGLDAHDGPAATSSFGW